MAQAKNPYIAGNPVGGSPAFVGRDDVLKAALRVLRDDQHHGLVLYGQRRVGKTSILKHLAEWLPKNGGPRAIYFDLQDKAAQPIGKILVDLASTVADDLDLPDPVPGPEPEAWFQETWLPGVLDGLPAGQSLAILLDEFDVLADAESQKAASVTFFGYLRELLAKMAPRLRLVFVIGRNLEDLSYLAGPLFKTLPSTHISLLLRQDAEALARLSEKNGSLSWSDGAIDKVWSLTHGHPYLLQHLCWQIWQRAHEAVEGAPDVVLSAKVEAAVPHTLDASRNALEWLWGGLPPAARVVAAALAKAGEGAISHEGLENTLKDSGVRVVMRELRDAPRLLGEWDIIAPVEAGYTFRVELLRRWIAEHKPLARVQQELDHIEPLAEALYRSGEGFFRTGDLDSALEQLQKAIKINPNHRRANELVAEILISRNAWNEARAVLARLSDNYPSEARPRLVQVLLGQADAAAKDDEKLDLYEQVLKLDEKNESAIRGKQGIWKGRGDHARSMNAYERAQRAYEEAGLSQLAVEMLVLEEQRLVMISSYEHALEALAAGDKGSATSLLAKVIGAEPGYKDAAKLLYETLSGEDVDKLKVVAATQAKDNSKTSTESTSASDQPTGEVSPRRHDLSSSPWGTWTMPAGMAGGVLGFLYLLSTDNLNSTINVVMFLAALPLGMSLVTWQIMKKR